MSGKAGNRYGRLLVLEAGLAVWGKGRAAAFQRLLYLLPSDNSKVLDGSFVLVVIFLRLESRMECGKLWVVVSTYGAQFEV